MSKRMDAREAIVRLINQAHAIHEAAWEALTAFDMARGVESEEAGSIEDLARKIDEICERGLRPPSKDLG